MTIEFSGIAPGLSTHAQALLQSKKLRLTFTRIATMALLLQESEPMTVDALFNKLTATGQPVSRASVYRAVTEFHKFGLILQGWEDIESGRMVYLRAPDRQPLTSYPVVCKTCGKTMALQDKLFAQQMYYHARQAGFANALSGIRFRVICNSCADLPA